MSTIKSKTNKVHSILMGRKVRRFYKLENADEWSLKNSLCEPKLEEDSETIERVKIGEYELPHQLKEKDEIFLSEKGVYTTIQKVTVGTDGYIYYNVSYVTEYIDDQENNKEKLLSKLNCVKQIYKENKEQNRANYLIEEASKKAEKLKIESKVEEIREWQQNNLDKIKGIIVHEIPKDKDNKPAINKEMQDNMINNMRLSIPKEYIVVPSMTKVVYLDCSDKNLSVDIR